jgi:uncharacterized membrane protein AbrB (regulator of aidB expression)
MTDDSARPLSRWTIIAIMVGACAALGVVLGLFGQELGIPRTINPVLIALFASSLAVYLRKRIRKGPERGERR